MKTKAVLVATAIFAFAGAVVIFGQTQSQDRTSSFVDPRDGQTYRTVLMPDGKTWMAQNLNFETESGSWCYDDDVANCEIYGRLYDWNTAMTACPQEWRLSSYDDWTALVNTVGGELIAGRKLKSQNGWNGTDAFGFSALLGGARWGGRFGNTGLHGNWWSPIDTMSALYGAVENMPYRLIHHDEEGISTGIDNKTGAFSVRCIRSD